MAHTPGGGPVTLAGTTWTEVVAAPAASRQRTVVSLLCMNLDNTTRTISLRRKKGVTTTLIHPDIDLGTGLAKQFVDGAIVLDDVDESLEMRTDATAALVEPVVDVAWMEKTA